MDKDENVRKQTIHTAVQGYIQDRKCLRYQCLYLSYAGIPNYKLCLLFVLILFFLVWLINNNEDDYDYHQYYYYDVNLLETKKINK